MRTLLVKTAQCRITSHRLLVSPLSDPRRSSASKRVGPTNTYNNLMAPHIHSTLSVFAPMSTKSLVVLVSICVAVRAGTLGPIGTTAPVLSGGTVANNQPPGTFFGGLKAPYPTWVLKYAAVWVLAHSAVAISGGLAMLRLEATGARQPFLRNNFV